MPGVSGVTELGNLARQQPNLPLAFQALAEDQPIFEFTDKKRDVVGMCMWASGCGTARVLRRPA